MTYTIKRGKEVIGWVTDEGCENPACFKAIEEGAIWHATPAGFAVTLDDYHCRTALEGVMRIHHIMQGIPGRNTTLLVGEDINWRNGTYGVGFPD